MGAHLVLGERPTCRCWGLLDQWVAQREAARGGVWMSLGMLGVLLLAEFTLARHDERGAPSGPAWGEPLCARVARRAFSLLELLVVVLIVAGLVAILAPSLGSARGAALRTKTLSHLHSMGGALASYTHDYREGWPLMFDPLATSWVVRDTLRERASETTIYFAQHTLWIYLIGPYAFSGEVYNPVMFPAEDPPTVSRTPLVYPCVFVADPAYWKPETREGRGQWRGTRVGEVVHPSAKVLLSSAHATAQIVDVRSAGDVRVPCLLAEGSARAPQLSEFKPGMSSGDGPWVPGAIHNYDDGIGWHTIDGVRGRDLP